MALDSAARRFLEIALGLTVDDNACLAQFSAIRVGGRAQALVRVENTDMLVRLLHWAHRAHQPFFLLGGGTNILFSDRGMDGLTIFNRCRALAVRATDTATLLEGDGGILLAQLARTSMRQGLTGLEWAVSVPGTLGGAVVGNAGAHGSDMTQILLQAELCTAEASPAWWSLPDLQMSYRHSILKPERPVRAGFPPIVARARLQLQPGCPDTIRRRARQFLQHRRHTQPVEPSLGSMFRNPPGHHAGALIEAAGCKGLACGPIAVSRQHANFFVNRGGYGAAKAAEVLALMQLVQARVHAHSGIRLHPEICLAGLWPEETVLC